MPFGTPLVACFQSHLQGKENTLLDTYLCREMSQLVLKYGSQVIIPFWCKYSIFLTLFLCIKNNDVAKNVNLKINL